jgi:hypothetical protein
MKGEQRLWVSEIRVLSRTFGQNINEMIGNGIIRHDETLYNTYSLPKNNQNNHVKENGMRRACSTQGNKLFAYSSL